MYQIDLEVAIGVELMTNITHRLVIYHKSCKRKRDYNFYIIIEYSLFDTKLCVTETEYSSNYGLIVAQIN